MIKTLAASAVLFAAAATPAQAVTFTTTLGSTAAFAAPTGGTVIDFNGTLPAGVTLTGTYNLVTGDVANAAQPAFSDGSRYLAVTSGNSATLRGSAGYQTISFFLGSIDTYNTIQVLSSTGAVLASYAGSAFTANANGNQDIPSTNRRVTFTASAGETLGGIVFGSTGDSLEVDNVVMTVPEPATWAMMLVGFALVAGASRYRRRNTTTVYA